MKNTNLLAFVLLAGFSAYALGADFSMAIKDTMRLSGQGVILTGKITTGTIRNGESLCVPLENGGQVGRPVKGMEKIAKVVDMASAGDNIGILVGDLTEEDIAVGQELTRGCAQ